MKHRIFLCAPVLLLVLFSACTKQIWDLKIGNFGYALMTSAQKQDGEAYQYAIDHGAEIKPTTDGATFTVWLEPPDFDPQTDITFVSLHGHAGWATDAFTAWHKDMEERGYAFLAIQWWFGQSMEMESYARHDLIYPWIQQSLEAHGVSPGQVIFEGFSMGSAVSYLVTAMDQQREEPYFAVTIANSGVMEPTEPYNKAIGEWRYGEEVYKGTSWILYCAMHDEEHENWCQQMQNTNIWIKELGGVVELFIQDPVGGHGGMMIPKNKEEVLDLAESLVES